MSVHLEHQNVTFLEMGLLQMYLKRRSKDWKEDSSLELSERAWPWGHLDFKLPAYRSETEECGLF